ncbi:LuxR C-terminal-related transcriptional regulator [Kitasatospora sp. McL0602]|uniref:LuxR C-terminal-related transcriptional regulator n=1 Tax=Kitasatospora sp. McL0602 TaxID=3439530 RepID=UPI003F8879D1
MAGPGSGVLAAFGVAAEPERVYFAMLEHPGAGPDELAALLGLDGEALRAALDELTRLALVRPSWEHPAALRPVSPEIGLEHLLARQQADLLTRRHQLEQGRAALTALLAEGGGARGGARTEIEELSGLDSVRERLEQLSTRARSEVLSFVTAGSRTAAARTTSRPLDQALLARGVAVRTVHLESVRNDPPAAAYAHWLTEHGGQVRTIATLPLRLIVVDRETALVPLDPDDSRQGAAVLRSRGAVAAMCALFDQTWAAATPLGLPRPRDEQGLSTQERALLDLLAQGDTDDSAARRLGVSDRTVRRLIADLTERLGARSRFQAGARAAARGWLR